MLTRLLPLLPLFLASGPAFAGWVVERTTWTEGQPGPSAELTLWIANGRVKEAHADGTYFLWDVERGHLFRVDPASKTYSGGAVKTMIEGVRRYLDDLRARLEKLSPEEREELARRAPGMPMPVPPPKTPPKWSVRETSRTESIAGHEARLYEILRDGILFEEKWIAADVSFGDDLDYARFSRWNRELEGSFSAGMGGASPQGESVDRLYEKGIELRSVLVGDEIRVVTEVRRLEERDVPPTTFTVPADYLHQDAQTSAAPTPKKTNRG